MTNRIKVNLTSAVEKRGREICMYITEEQARRIQAVLDEVWKETQLSPSDNLFSYLDEAAGIVAKAD